MRSWALSLGLLLAACSADPHRAVRAQAEQLAAKGDFASALELLNRYLIAHPTAQSVREEQFRVLLKADRQEAAITLLMRQPDPAHWLTDALGHPDPAVRAAAARVACDQPQPALLPVLRRHTDDPAVEVRRYSTRALGCNRDRDALKQLFRALHDPNGEVRAEAAQALTRIGDPRAIGWLIVAAGDDDRSVRYQVFEALDALASPATQALLRTAWDRVNPKQKLAVAFALAKLGDATGLPSLLEAATNPDRDIRRRAAVALGQCASPAAERTLRVLAQDDERTVRLAAQTALDTARLAGDTRGK